MKAHKDFAEITKPLSILTHHNTKFDWIPYYQVVFISLKGALIQAPILHYPDPSEWYIVYTYASDDACGGQLSQEHNDQELPVIFLSHIYRHWKCSTPKEEDYGVL